MILQRKLPKAGGHIYADAMLNEKADEKEKSHEMSIL